MSDIAIIGNLREVLPFRAIGLKIYAMDEFIQAGATKREVINNILAQGHKIMIVTEEYFEEFSEIYEAKRLIKKDKMGIIIPIQNGIDKLDIGKKKLKELVEKAIGVDIFKESK